jgi:ParB-like chromosome segregation protein Spo0J
VNLAEKIVMRPIGALIPYASNARTHSDAQIAQIAASIREFGLTNPVLVAQEADLWDRTMMRLDRVSRPSLEQR